MFFGGPFGFKILKVLTTDFVLKTIAKFKFFSGTAECSPLKISKNLPQ